MKFKATDEQVKQMAANAINASTPMGLGHLHYDPTKTAQAEDIKFIQLCGGDSISLDYVGGRMVKFGAAREEEDIWRTLGNTDEADPEYQSWCKEYKTFKDICDSVGAEIVE